MVAGCLFELSRSFLSTRGGVALEARTGNLNGSLKMGQSALIAANGTEWQMADQYYVSANFFHSVKKHSAGIRWSDPLALHWEKKAFICPVVEPECYRLVQGKKNRPR